MKTLLRFIFAIACISLILACSKSNDDPVAATSPQTLKKVNAAGTGTVVSDFQEQSMSLPIFCDGYPVDVVTSSDNFIMLARDHYQDGDHLWWINSLKSIVFTSQKSGEIFKMEGWEKTVISDGFDQLHFTLVGDKGSHYSCQMTADIENSQVFEVRSVCSKKFVNSLQ